ncbi:hypothetical protein WISP_142381 [Willisornis vidua]|uniref:Cation efflux protein cytoplasmic domain-containing protein n=1 Tax=Willisornis vidua TaxID=1566151 RepID=A0ABQ9CS42_9PASS|nr:hypothetical protein WISP_142381 [Willisornis vidua]
MRLLHPDYDIDTTVMLIISACAVLANILSHYRNDYLVKFGFRLNSEFHVATHPVTTVLTLNEGHHGTSKGFTYDEAKARILAVEKVESVHNLHIWSLTMNQTVLSAHVATADTTDSQKILRDITQALFEHYSFHSITIQIESGDDQKQDCTFCQEPRD